MVSRLHCYTIMKKDKHIQKELEELSPLLSQMKKQDVEDGFQVPFNFFEELPDLVLEQTKTKQAAISPTTSTIKWWDNIKTVINVLFQPRYAIGFATIALLVIAMLYLMPNPSIQATAYIDLEEISAEEIDTYISQHLDDFQEEILEQEALVDVFENEESLHIDDAELEEYFEGIVDEVELENLL